MLKKSVERWFKKNLKVGELDRIASEAMEKNPILAEYGYVVHVCKLADSPVDLLKKIGVPIPKTPIYHEVDEEELLDRFNTAAQYIEDLIHEESELEDGRYLVMDDSKGVQLIYREEIYG